MLAMLVWSNQAGAQGALKWQCDFTTASSYTGGDEKVRDARKFRTAPEVFSLVFLETPDKAYVLGNNGAGEGIANLMDAGVDFVACDQPFASRLTLHILAAVAEDEARRISERTRAALAAAKRGGRKLGTAGSVDTAARARAARSEQANKANATTRAVIAEIQRAGKTTLAAIAQELEARGVRNPAGRDRWAPAQVSRLLA